jgi:hypothetical protein
MCNHAWKSVPLVTMKNANHHLVLCLKGKSRPPKKRRCSKRPVCSKLKREKEETRTINNARAPEMMPGDRPTVNINPKNAMQEIETQKLRWYHDKQSKKFRQKSTVKMTMCEVKLFCRAI